MNTKSKKRISIVGLFTLFFMVGCQGQIIDTNELVVAQSGDPVSLDPHATNDNRSALVINQIFEPLVRQTENLELIPWLAESWERIDDRTYEFHLREGVYFHNGEPMRASDVKFSMVRATKSPTSRAILGEINPDSIEIINDYTIRIGTHEPFAPLLAHLAHTSGNIMSEKAATYHGDNFGQNPVGTGPFVFKNWIQGDRVELARNNNYHGDMANTERLVIRNITEIGNRLIELETGQVDIAMDISPTDIERVNNHAELKLIQEPNLRMHYIGFNTQHEQMNDVRIRQAINYAIDVNLIIDTILEGSGIRALGPLPIDIFGAHQDLEGYGHDPERAKELLAEAEIPNGFSLSILTDDDTVRVTIATVVRSQLERVGIDASIEILEWATFLDATANGTHEMFIMGWTSVTADADYGLFPLFHSSMFGAGGNRAFYSNERVDQLLEQAREELDAEIRLAYYLEIQEIIVRDAPWVFLNVGENVIGLRENVRGFVANPSGHHRFSRVSLEK